MSGLPANIEFLFNVSRKGDTLILDKLHIQGVGRGGGSLSELKRLAKEFAEANDAENILIKGGFRNKNNRTPRDIAISIK